MAVSMEEVRAVLDPEEPDYDFAALLGPSALPHLEVLVSGGDPMLASKAAYLAGLLDDAQSSGVLALAAQRDDAIVRVAAAAGAQHLSQSGASDVLISLLSDADAGVRLVALKSVPLVASSELRAKVSSIQASESETAVRDLSVEVLRRMDASPRQPDSGSTAEPDAPDPATASAPTPPGEMPGASDGSGPVGTGEMPGASDGPTPTSSGEMPGAAEAPATNGLGEMPGESDRPAPGRTGEMPG